MFTTAGFRRSTTSAKLTSDAIAGALPLRAGVARGRAAWPARRPTTAERRDAAGDDRADQKGDDGGQRDGDEREAARHQWLQL